MGYDVYSGLILELLRLWHSRSPGRSGAEDPSRHLSQSSGLSFAKDPLMENTQGPRIFFPRIFPDRQFARTF
jgi:hypothetical protein